MALNPSAVGKQTAPLTHTYRWNDSVLYALGVGAKRDAELDFLYEGRGPKVLPTFAVIPTFAANAALFDVIGGNLMGVVHGGQSITLHAPFRAADTLTTVGTVAAIYDLKRMAQAVVTTETRGSNGTLLCETEWSVIYRADGGFGGEPPPKREHYTAPARPADWTFEDLTSQEQALLYRLNGDLNPLHADPEISQMAGFSSPILHGLCTYGYVGRAVLRNECGLDPARFKQLTGQFRRPVFPGDTLVIEGWREGQNLIVRASVKERPGEAVFQGSASVS